MKCKIYPQWKRSGAKVKKSVCIGTDIAVNTNKHSDYRKIALAMLDNGTRITGEMTVFDYEIHAHGMRLTGYEGFGEGANEKRFYQEWWCLTYEKEKDKS